MTKLTRIRGGRILPFGLLIAGMVFLFNPTVNLIDLLPDAIGYALLMLALRYTAEVFPHFDAARRGFRTLFWINVAKIPAASLMLNIAAGNPTERTIITIFALAFAIVEWIFLIPALRALLEGFTYLGVREGIRSAITLCKSERFLDVTTVLVLIFFFFKGACTFLPEMVFVPTEFRNGSITPSAFNPATLYMPLALLTALAVLAFGGVCLILVVIYLIGMKRDGAMKQLLEDKAAVVTPALRAGADVRRKNLFFIFLLAGFFFAIDMPLNNVDVLPDYVAAALFFAAFLMADKGKAALLGKIFAPIYGVCAILRAVFANRFFALFDYYDVGGGRNAAIARYNPLLVAYVLEAVFFLVTVILLVRTLRAFVLRYTGKDLRPQDTEIRNEVHAELGRGCGILTVATLLYSILRPVSVHLRTIVNTFYITSEQANEIVPEGIRHESKYAWLWILVLVAGAVLFVMALVTARAIKLEANLSKEDE